MANQRQPIQLIEAKGRKHLTKAEIEQRRKSEVQPLTDGIKPPKYLTKEQKKRFKKLAKDLAELEIISRTDVDALARYVKAEELYIAVTDKLTDEAVLDDISLLEKYAAVQDKYFKQCRAAANDLGLSISSRCRLVVPKAEPATRENKFDKFNRTAG